MNPLIKKLKAFPITDGEITSVRYFEHLTVPGPNPLKISIADTGAYYRVDMILRPAPDSHIGLAVCLPEPENWNGKFLGTGNGGGAGQIAEGGLLNGLSRRYAVANTDLGTSPNANDWIGHPDVFDDFGWRATHLMTTIGKALTAWFYGREPKYSYYYGGSTGGQQAFSEAQRYPEDYDGIVCLSPAFDRMRLHAFFIWNWQAIHSEPDGVFTPETVKAWRDVIIKRYGAECGSNPDDWFLCYPGRIKGNPMDDPELQKEAESILTPGQRNALRKIYDGPKDPVTGERFIAHFLPGTETEGLSLVDYSDKEAFDSGYFFPYDWASGKPIDGLKFSFHDDLWRCIEKLGPVLDARDPDLSAYKARGGKLFVVGGSSDAIIPYTGFLDYYRKVIELQGGIEETKKFFRFVLMPGFSHTIGGSGVQDVGSVGITATPRDADHDALMAMERWVEEGAAPERLLGTHFKTGEEGLAFDYARPGYVYPLVTKFMDGDPKDPENYCGEENPELYV